MANFWIQDGKWAVSGNYRIRFGALVKSFGRKYKGMWRVFGISENGEIMLVSDEYIGEIRLLGLDGYLTGIDQLEQLCIDTVQSSKVASVRSLNSLDFERLSCCKERYEILKKHLYKHNCWLATTYTFSKTLHYEEGMDAIYEGIIVNMPLKNFPGEEYNITLGVRAIVTLRKNVEFKETKDGYWRI